MTEISTEYSFKMPLAQKPVCSECKSTNSDLWRKVTDEEFLCNECYLKEVHPERRANSENGSKNGNGSSNSAGIVRKSARIKPSKYRSQSAPKPLATKGKSRRVVFKKNPIKAPASVATVVTSDYIFFKGSYLQVGDVVSVVDEDDGHVYYAQLRGFLQDQYMEKSAIITWLLPTTASPPESFDPSTFILGPEEDIPRKLDCFDFVCHAPSDYFKVQGSPYPTVVREPGLGCILTTVGAEIRRIPPRDEVLGLREASVESSIEDTDRLQDTTKTDKVKVKQEKKEDRKEKKRESIKERRESARERRERKRKEIIT